MMNKSKTIPFLSILIPTWNRVSQVANAVESIGHLHKQIEVIIVDNASSKETFKNLQKTINQYSQVRLFQNHENIGMVKNWNQCIAYARADWMGLLCSDDEYIDGAIPYVINLLETIEEPSLLIQDNFVSKNVAHFPSGKNTVKGLNLPLASGNFWHKKIVETIGGFDERLEYSPDAEFWPRIASQFPVVKVKKSLAKYNAHHENYMWSTWNKDDFLDQIALIGKLSCKYRLGNDYNEDVVIKYIENGVWQTIKTILTTTSHLYERKTTFDRYLNKSLDLYANDKNKIQFLTQISIDHTVFFNQNQSVNLSINSLTDRISANLKTLTATDISPPTATADRYQSILKYCSTLDANTLSRFTLNKTDVSVPHTSTNPKTISQLHAIVGCDIGELAFSISVDANDTLLILAPSIVSAFLMLDFINPAKLFAPMQVCLFINPDNFLTHLKKIQNFWKPIYLQLTPQAHIKQPELCSRINKEIELCNSIAENEAKTLNQHYFNWAENENRNLKKMVQHCHAISTTNSQLAGSSALLIGAGPSLKKILPYLKKIKQNNQVLIIAASTVLRTLIKEEIIPHFTIIIEAKKQSHFDNLPVSFIKKLCLIAALQTNPEHLNYPFKEIYWFHHQASPTIDIVRQLIPEAIAVESGGNVIIDGLQLALNWGCSTINLCGCDLAYDSNKKYYSGLEKDGGNQEESNKKFIPVPGQQGNTLFAPIEFVADAQRLEDIMAKLECKKQKLCNLSVEGRTLKGIEEKPPKQFYNLSLKEKSGMSEKLQKHIESLRQPHPKDISKLNKHFQTLEKLHNTLILYIQRNINSNSDINIAHINTIRYLLNLLPEFSNGAALIMVPWLRRIYKNEHEEEDIVQLLNTVIQLLKNL